MKARAALLALVLTLGLAACGGDDGDDEPAAEPPPAETDDAGDGAAGGSSPEGREVFIANCGSCHTLSDAGTAGSVGPSLDEFSPSQETVERQVRQGGGAMPAFEGRLSDAEIQAVSDYVAEHAGG